MGLGLPILPILISSSHILQITLLFRLENGKILMVSLVPGQSMETLTDGLMKMVPRLEDLLSIQMSSLELGGMMDTRVMSIHGPELMEVISDTLA